MFKQTALFSVLFLVLLCALERHAVNAATRLTDDFAALVGYSQAVVNVRVLRSETRAGNEIGMPMTFVTVAIDKVHKGPLAAGNEIVIECFGGADGGQQTIVPGQARLEPGMRALLLLADVGGHWRVLGGDAGQTILFQTSDGETWAYRLTGKFEYFESDAGSITGYNRVESKQLKAENLSALVHTVMTTGQAVIGPSTANTNKAAEVQHPVAASIAAVETAPVSTHGAAGQLARGLILFSLVAGAWLFSRRLTPSRR